MVQPKSKFSKPTPLGAFEINIADARHLIPDLPRVIRAR